MDSTNTIPLNKEELLKYVMAFEFGGMSKEELGCLYDICHNKEVLELGSMVGMSSYTIASVAKHLSCVDIWSDKQDHLKHDPRQAEVYMSYLGALPNMLKEFNKNCKEFIESGKISMYQGNTKEMSEFFANESFDIIVIDADHSYEGVSKDFELYHNKVKADGLIVFHDYGDVMWQGIKKFCDKMVKEGKLKLIHKTQRIAVFKKI